MKSASPYLNFKGNTKEAFNFYRSVFGGEFQTVVRFRDFGDNGMGVAQGDLDKIAHIALPLGPHAMLMGTDVVDSMPMTFTPGNNVYITIEPESAEETERLFSALSAGGRTEMPLQATAWAEKYGSCTDRFGVQWMVSYAGSVQFAPARSA
jgi:PhnB protein